MEQRNQCDNCGRSFQLQIQLNLHKKKKHPEIVKPIVKSSVTLSSSSLKNDGSTTAACESSSLFEKSVPKSPREIYKYVISSIPPTIHKINDKPVNSSHVKLANGICSKPPHHHRNIISLSHTSKNNNNHHRSTIEVEPKNSRHPLSPKKCRKSKPQKIFEELRKSQRFRTDSSASYNNYGFTTCNVDEPRHFDNPNQKVSCFLCKKISPNKKLLAIHLRKIHSAKDNNNISALPTGAQVTIRENLSAKGLKPWSCKKCGKYFSSYHQRWKHQINICGLGTKYKCPVCPSQFRKFIDLCAHRSLHNSRGQLKLKQTKSDLHQTSTSPTLKEVQDIKDAAVVGSKCRFSSCQKIFKNRKELCQHSEKSHNLFMCLQCPSILTTKEKLFNHCDLKHSQSTLNANKVTVNTSSSSPSESTGMRNEVLNEATSGGRINNNNNKKDYDMKQDSSHQESAKIGEETKSVTLIHKTIMTCKPCNLNFTKLGLYLKHNEEQHQNVDLAYRNGDDVVNSNDFGLMKSASHKIPNESHTLEDTMTPIEIEIFKDHGKRTPTRKYSEADTTSLSSEEMKETKKSRKKNIISSPFKCGICSLEFSKEKSFFYHMSQQVCISTTHPYTCEECGQGFTRETNLKQHIKVHHKNEGDEYAREDEELDDQPWCKICRKNFAHQSTLNRHIRNLHPEMWYEETLPELDRFSPLFKPEETSLSPSPPPRLIPRLSSQPENFKQPLPAITTNRKRSLTPDADQSIKIGRTLSPSHLSFQQVHAPEKCNQCAQVFRTSLELAQHLLLHNKAKAVPKTFESVRKTSQKIYFKCPICGLGGFKIRSDIVSHAKKKHTRIGQYSCPYNGCKVISRTAVQVCDHVTKIHEVDEELVAPSPPSPHARVVHKTTTNIVFPCMEIDCNGSFGSVHELSDHLEESHPGHKFFICSRHDCRIPFRSNKLLQKHSVEQHGKRK